MGNVPNEPASIGADPLLSEVAVGRRLTLTISALSERVAFAERETRAASWEGPEEITARLARVASADADMAAALDKMASDEARPAGEHVATADLGPQATAATDAASEAVAEAFGAVSRAHRAVLDAQLATASQQAATGRIQRKLRSRVSGGRARLANLAGAVTYEIRYQLVRTPRTVLKAVLFAVLAGILYLGYIRLFDWTSKAPWAPYLAVLFVSSVMGSSVSYNSFGLDARRVRVALDSGARLWEILLVKNLALMVVVFPLGLAMSVALALLTGRPATLIASIGLVLCILLLWGGVGNLLSVVLPIRDAPLKVHREEGTLKQFVIEFAVTWCASYLVMFLLIWRVYSAQGMGHRYGSTWIGVLLLVGSGILAWVNMTVMATAFTNVPSVRRRLRRELDWEPADSSTPDATAA